MTEERLFILADESEVANYNRKEIIIILRNIDRLLTENNAVMKENNQLLKDINQKLRSISFNTNT